MKRIVLTVAAVVALAFPASVSAGGQRTVEVGSPHVGDAFHVTGCGYTKPEVTIYLYRSVPYTNLAGGAAAAPGGCFEWTAGYVFDQPGAYEVEVYGIKGTAGPGSYNQNHAAAELDFTVLP